MRTAPVELTAALTGSRAGDRMIATLTRGGDVLSVDVPLTRWSFTSDITRSVRDQVTLDVVDADGGAAPWGAGDAWAPAGSMVELSYLCPAAGVELPVEPLRVVRTPVDEMWRLRRRVTRIADGQPVFGGDVMLGSATMAVSAESPTVGAAAAQYAAPVASKYRTVLAEVRHILSAWCPVDVHPSVVDGAVPVGYVHDGNPLTAAEALLSTISATHRMSGGVFEVLPETPTWGPTHTIAWGDPDGTLVSAGRELAMGDLVNRVVVTGADVDGRPVAGSASITSGPLAVTGPHGVVPLNVANSALLSNAACATLAEAILASRTRGARIVLPIRALPDPTIQVHDVIQLVHPLGTIACPVVGVTLSGTTAGVDVMEVRVAAYLADLAAMRGGS